MATEYGNKIDNYDPETQTVEELDGLFTELVKQKGLAAFRYIDVSRRFIAKEHLQNGESKHLKGELFLQSPTALEIGYYGYRIIAIDYKNDCLLIGQSVDERKIINALELMKQIVEGDDNQ